MTESKQSKYIGIDNITDIHGSAEICDLTKVQIDWEHPLCNAQGVYPATYFNIKSLQTKILMAVQKHQTTCLQGKKKTNQPKTNGVQDFQWFIIFY